MAIILDKPVSDFFFNVDRKNALVFTSFGLDETVMVELLKKHNVDRNQRIVVYHEIMKHNNPGFLLHNYPNSKVVSIDLIIDNKDKLCPIFHSKLWLEISKNPFKCMRLAVLSGNITRYHFDSSNKQKTYETFAVLPKQGIKLPKDIFEKDAIFRGRGRNQLRIRPATYVINADDQAITIQRKEISVYEVISLLMKDNNETLIACAAPFVNKTPIRNLLNACGKSHADINILSGRRKDGTSLHAKAIETNKHVFLGSPNITSQAYGFATQGIVNHESIVVERKPKGFSLASVLKGFERISLENFDDNYNGEFGADGGDYSDWIERKKLSVNGPESITLFLDEKSNRAGIVINGSFGGATNLTIHNFTSDRESDALITCVPKKRLLFTNNKQQMLVKAVLSPPVYVKGYIGSKEIWRRELDLDKFWGWIQNHVNLRKFMVQHESNDGLEINGNNGNSPFSDVRDLRLKAYSDDHLTPEVHRWHEWITKYDSESWSKIPRWCADLSRRLKGSHNA